MLGTTGVPSQYMFLLPLENHPKVTAVEINFYRDHPLISNLVVIKLDANVTLKIPHRALFGLVISPPNMVRRCLCPKHIVSRYLDV